MFSLVFIVLNVRGEIETKYPSMAFSEYRFDISYDPILERSGRCSMH